jgi:hypothetical protein
MTIPTTEISARASGLPVQAIREVMELAWRQPDAIHLEVGEPGFPTPAHIVEAAARVARDGHTKYRPNTGIVALREALAEKVGRVNGYAATPDQVVVGAGGVQVLHTVLLALTDPGDEILLPDPASPDFVQMAHLLGITAPTTTRRRTPVSCRPWMSWRSSSRRARGCSWSTPRRTRSARSSRQTARPSWSHSPSATGCGSCRTSATTRSRSTARSPAPWPWRPARASSASTRSPRCTR